MTVDPVVYVVDDDEAVRDSMLALLEAAEFRVAAFGSGQEFLKANVAASGGCVLLDVRMPEMDGLEIQARMRADGIDLPVIIITGHGDVPLAVKAMKAGAIDFIEKPIQAEVIVSSVRGALEINNQISNKKSAIDETAARIAQLTPRESEVFGHLIVGRQNKEIAHELRISPRTVEIHRARVMEKMQARSLSHLVRMALESGFDPEAS